MTSIANIKIQLALDRISIKKCHTIVAETSSVIDIVEIGTSLILEHGVSIVREFKKRHAGVKILADTKIADSGSYESKLFYDVGADFITVLGVASDRTILAVKQQAAAYKKEIMVDMMNTPNPLDRIRQLEEWNIDYACLHQGIDEQSGNKTIDRLGYHTKLLEQLHGLKHLSLAVAGGLDPDKIKKIKHLPIEIAIVGSYVTSRNEGWKKAVESIRAIR